MRAGDRIGGRRTETAGDRDVKRAMEGLNSYCFLQVVACSCPEVTVGCALVLLVRIPDSILLILLVECLVN